MFVANDHLSSNPHDHKRLLILESSYQRHMLGVKDKILDDITIQN